MISATTHHLIDEAGVEAVLDAAERHALDHGHRVVIAVVERSGELVGLRRTPGRADRQLPRAHRQGTHRCDLRSPQPRTRAASVEWPARRARVYLLDGSRARGNALLFAGLVLWLTNILIFGIWYWELDVAARRGAA